MTISNFFNSYVGMYVAQAFCHSVVASVISDQALRAWNILDPAVRQRFRVIVVLVPIFSFPLYQAFGETRSSLQFRLTALFDVNQWINMEIWGIVPVGVLFLAMLSITTLVFALQELLPIIIHTREAKTVEQEGVLRAPDPFIEESSRALSITTPDVVVVEDDALIVYSTTGRKPVIYVSRGLVTALTLEQLQSALAHELGHIARSRRPVLLMIFILRIIMFFNPVSLVEFRRVVRNEEKVCDDIAVSLTNRPEDLVEVLRKFLPITVTPEPATAARSLFSTTPLEDYSHTMQLESRIARLTAHIPGRSGGEWPIFVFTVLIIAVINYFIV